MYVEKDFELYEKQEKKKIKFITHVLIWFLRFQQIFILFLYFALWLPAFLIVFSFFRRYERQIDQFGDVFIDVYKDMEQEITEAKNRG